MILHFLTDEKFSDYVVQQFSAPEMKSDFVCLNTSGDMDYVKMRDQILVMSPYTEGFSRFLEHMGDYSAIVLHGMHWGPWQSYILRKVPDHVKVAWYFWGGEIYGRHELKDRFYAPLTKFLYKLHTFKNRDKRDLSWELPLELYKRVDYCLTAEQEEFEFAKQFTGASFEYLWYNCYSIDETVGALMNSQCEGNNIWIGNSAAAENNHFDVLWMLWKIGMHRKLKEEKVIIPLSYGSQWMRNIVLKYGRILLGKRMQALTEFMPREEYNKLMLSCSTMIIGYWEPAAQGNIITALWLGMRIYLSEKSMTYSFFKRLGANVFSIESDLKKYQFTPLSEEVRAENRRVLSKWFSKQHVMESVQNVVNELSEPKKIND